MKTIEELNTVRVLSLRLEALRDERDELATSTRAERHGDIADQTVEVEALIRLQLLDERIAALELEIADAHRRTPVDGIVSIGDLVTIDFGVGDETYLIGSVEQARAGLATITPGSPLGKALVGAAVGSVITYEPTPGTPLEVTVRSTGQMLAATA